MILFGVVAQTKTSEKDFELTNCKRIDSLSVISLLDATFLTEGYSCDSALFYRNFDQDTSYRFDFLEGLIFKRDSIHVYFNEYPNDCKKMGFFNEKKELKYILYFDGGSKYLKGISKVDFKGHSVFEKFIFVYDPVRRLDKILLSDFYEESFYEELYMDNFHEDKCFEKEHKRYKFSYLFWLD